MTGPADGRIQGLDADLHDVGELTPTIAALCALAETPSRLRGVAHLRGHETDRLAAIVTEITRLGGRARETADGVEIEPAPLHGGVVESYHDHRMATFGAILGLRVPGVRVVDVAHHRQDAAGLPRHVAGDAGGARLTMARDTGTDDARVRIRPNPKGTRPRTKRRPEHADAVDAMVLGVDRGRYHLLTDDGIRVVGMKARELGRTGSVVVGDRVGVVGDVSGRRDTLARIVRVEPRTSVLRRSAEDGDAAGAERIIVANADQLLIVTALADPEPRPRMVDRCLVAAYDAGMAPVLCLTKADLADPAPFLAQYDALQVQALVTSATGAEIHGLDAVRERLAGRVSVLIGHSGVGKSTLVNALVPEAGRATGDVNAVTGRGRHTSSSAVALELPGGGWVIDTPGVRSFGLSHVGADSLLHAFPDLDAVAQECPRGCTHAADAPDCALDEWVAAGRAGPAGAARLASFRRLLAAKTGAAES